MSSPAIEARSLSNLTALASNPPSYPRNPTHVRHEPLVLYIARVPGSRGAAYHWLPYCGVGSNQLIDVFLSPMKPRDKVVSAEDIQNSLYFIHAEQPEDSRLVIPPEVGYEDRRPSSSSAIAVQRKAVPGAPSLSHQPPTSARKPLPPYPLSPTEDFDNRQNINARNFGKPDPTTLHPNYAPRRSFEATPYEGENARPSLPSRFSSELSSSGTCLTLIRRDPASGAQWNVATVEDPPTPDVSSSSLNDTGSKRKAGAPLYIEIANPGYSKFLHQPERPDLVNTISDDLMKSRASPRTLGSIPQSTIGIPGQDETVFRRRLWMEGSKYNGGGFGHRKLGSYDANMGRESQRNIYDANPIQQRLSVDFRAQATSQILAHDDQRHITAQGSERQPTFRGYVFMSPWNGRCEFITGAGGGSLKCRHVIHGPRGAPPLAMPVSELRFNLPSTSRATTPQGEEGSKRSSFFHRPRHHRHQSSDMDLSLGQEYAGGGFGGKQAKLGKLIIDDEGLKMIDLLVAANMALWWRAYEKV